MKLHGYRPYSEVKNAPVLGFEGGAASFEKV